MQVVPNVCSLETHASKHSGDKTSPLIALWSWKISILCRVDLYNPPFHNHACHQFILKEYCKVFFFSLFCTVGFLMLKRRPEWQEIATPSAPQGDDSSSPSVGTEVLSVWIVSLRTGLAGALGPCGKVQEGTVREGVCLLLADVFGCLGAVITFF